MPFTAMASGEKEPFLPNRTPLPGNKVSTKSEGWVELCAQAAVEQDPKKLLELVSEINCLLDTRRKRLAEEREGKLPRS